MSRRPSALIVSSSPLLLRSPLLSAKPIDSPGYGAIPGTPWLLPTSAKPFHNETPSVAKRHRIGALMATLLLSIGSHYAAQTFGALKPDVVAHLDIPNASFATLQSAVALFNTVAPLLAGILLDRFGSGFGSVLATFAVLLGNVIVAMASSMVDYRMMLAGRLIYGLGSGCIMVVQDAILARWFSGRALAIALGLQIAVSRAASYAAMITVYPIARAAGFYGAAFWVAAALCAVSCIANLTYLRLLRHLRSAEQLRDDARRLAEKRRFRPRVLLHFPLAFWAIVLVAFLLTANCNTFLHTVTDLVQRRYHYPVERAASIAGLAQLMPVFVAPFLGYLYDLHGRRASAIATSGLLLATAAYLLLHPSSLADPALPMLVFSLSLAFGPIAIVASIPRILPSYVVGTALGLCKSAMNVGIIIFDIMLGHVQDRSGGNYDAVLHVYLGVGLAAAFVAMAGIRRGWAGVLLEAGRHAQAHDAAGACTQPSSTAALSDKPLIGSAYTLACARMHAACLTADMDNSTSRKASWNAWLPIVIFVIAVFTSWIVFFVNLA